MTPLVTLDLGDLDLCEHTYLDFDFLLVRLGLLDLLREALAGDLDFDLFFLGDFERDLERFLGRVVMGDLDRDRFLGAGDLAGEGDLESLLLIVFLWSVEMGDPLPLLFLLDTALGESSSRYLSVQIHRYQSSHLTIVLSYSYY